MWNFLQRWRGPQPSFDSIQFDDHGWQQVSSAEGELGPLWKTPDGDAIGLSLIRKRPKLPQSMDLYGFRNVFLRTMQSERGVPVELGTLKISECPALRFLYKMPQKDAGMAYAGTVTIPFQRFCFIYEAQCVDQGSTEVRESLLAERGVDCTPRAPQKWPPAGPTPQADLAQFDAEFPHSPVARLRRILTRIADTASIEERIACLPVCQLPN